jgi:integrase
MHRLTLTDRKIKALKPAKAGERPILWDALVPSFGIRSTDKGSHTFGVVARFGSSKHPTWRAIGDVRTVALPDARATARTWLTQLKSGIDPRAVEEAKRKAEEEKRRAEEGAAQAIFGAVVEVFLAEYVHGRKLRTTAAIERRIRNELLPHWADRSVHTITRDDVEDLLLRIVKRPALRYAHSILDDCKMFFGWLVDVVDRRKPYKLQASPCDRIKPTKLIGPKNIRTRVLGDQELRTLWKAADTVGYPIGPLVQMLALTGCRLNEVAGARWREIGNELWVVPAERFKSNAEHRVPITPALATLLSSLPRFKSGECLFSFCFGKTPVANFSSAKRQIDEHMGDVQHWSFHDIRRTVRTRLAALRVPDHVAEVAIGHGRKGLARVYDQHRYDTEVRDAMTAWSNMLRNIVAPAPNVVALDSARA